MICFLHPSPADLFLYFLAAYEAVRFQKEGNTSITKELKGFPEMPIPEKNKKYNDVLAATKAFFTVAEKITFSKDTLISYENKVYSG